MYKKSGCIRGEVPEKYNSPVCIYNSKIVPPYPTVLITRGNGAPYNLIRDVMRTLKEKDVLTREMAVELCSDISSKKPITNGDGEELGSRYYFYVSNGVLELDVFDGETIEDKFTHVFYVHRKAKDGTKVWRVKRPVNLREDAAFSMLFEQPQPKKRKSSKKA